MQDKNIGSHSISRPPVVRIGRWLVVCALALSTLTACDSGFLYNRLDWISRYYVSSQVSLDDAQSRALAANVDAFFAWHRHSELPRYAGFLDRMADDAVRPVTVQQLEAGQREVQSFMRDAYAHGAPAAARWLNGLRLAQVEELFASLAEKDRKRLAEKCRGTPAERRAKGAAELIDKIEDWTGRLDRAQRDMITLRYATLETDECEELTVRAQARQEFHALVTRYRGRPEFAERIAGFLAHPEERRDAAYRAHYETDRARFLALLADISHSLTPAQRQHTIERLRTVAREMRGLAAESDEA